MIDERFSLTPVDVRTQEFGRKLNGYDPVRVEEFRTRVAEELERLIRLNHELDGKHKAAIEQLRAFRDRDKALNEALVSAQVCAETRDRIARWGDEEAQGLRALFVALTRSTKRLCIVHAQPLPACLRS